jgi:hypothetical protein
MSTRNYLLPEEWPAADKAVAAAWDEQKKVAAYVNGLPFLGVSGRSKADLQAAVETLKNVVQNFSLTTEKLKRGQLANPNAIADWKRMGEHEIPDFARTIKADANFSSLKGFVREVGIKSVKEAVADVTSPTGIFGRYVYIAAAIAAVVVAFHVVRAVRS